MPASRTDELPRTDSSAPRAEAGRPFTALAVWGLLVAGAIVVGNRLVEARPEMRISAAPFAGSWERVGGLRWAIPLAVGALAILVGPALTRRLPWRGLIAATGGLAVVWLLALNAVDGPGALRDPLTTRYEYIAGLPDIGAAGGLAHYLASFTERIDAYPTHVRGHPPGMVSLLWAAEGLGLDATTVALALVLGGWALAAGAVLFVVRDLAGEVTARRAALFVALTPGAIWAGTSVDAWYAGVVALGIALVVSGSGRIGDLRSGLGGAVLGGAVLLTYGALPLLLVPVAVSLHRRRARSLLVTGAGGVAVLLAAGLAGFWWPDGLAATRAEYAEGLSGVRPYGYWVVGNLAALAVATGPAAAAGLSRLRPRSPLGVLLTATLAAVLVADLSGLSKGEVERIWLPFVPWLVLAAVGLTASTSDASDRSDRALRGWIGAQVVTAVAIQVTLRSPW